MSYVERLEICLQRARDQTHDGTQQELFKVPPGMRHANASEYEATFFSFGLHKARFDVKLDFVEPCDYCKIEIAKLLTTKGSFQELVRSLVTREGDIRKLYRQQSCHEAASRDIAYVLALDALTVVAAACYQHCVKPRSMCPVIWRDAFLMEQQLPLFVLHAAIENITVLPSYCDLCISTEAAVSSPAQIIEYVVNFYARRTSYPFIKNVKQRAWRGRPPLLSTKGAPVLDMQLSLLHHVHISFIHAAAQTSSSVDHVVSTQLKTLPTASELRAYGIHFAVGDGDFTGIRFDKKSRVLTVPEITVFSTTKSYLLNLVAQEAAVSSYDDDPCPVSSFILVMGFLVEAEEDVRVLVQAKVLYNHMGSNAQLAAMWNSLGVNLPISLTDGDSNLINAVREACDQRLRSKALGLLNCLDYSLSLACTKSNK